MSSFSNSGTRNIMRGDCPAIYQLATDGRSIQVCIPAGIWPDLQGRICTRRQELEAILQGNPAKQHLPQGRQMYLHPTALGDEMGYGGFISTRESEDRQWAIISCPLPTPVPPPVPTDFRPICWMDICVGNLNSIFGGLVGAESDCPEQQLVELGCVTPFAGGFATLSRRIVCWVGDMEEDLRTSIEAEVSQTMRQARNFILYGDEVERYDKNSYGVHVGLGNENLINFHCHLVNSGSVSNMSMSGGSGQDRAGYWLLPHNIDGPLQLLVIAVGLAKLCELARRDLYPV